MLGRLLLVMPMLFTLVACGPTNAEISQLIDARIEGALTALPTPLATATPQPTATPFQLPEPQATATPFPTPTPQPTATPPADAATPAAGAGTTTQESSQESSPGLG